MTKSLRVTFGLVLASALLMPGCSAFKRLSGREQKVFVTSYKDDTVSVLGGDPERELTVIEVGDSPVGIALRPGGELVAVANSTGKRVTFIDPESLQIVRRVQLEDVLEHLVFSADGKLLFVTLPKARKIAVIDVDSGAVQPSIAVERKAKRLVVSPDGKRLYAVIHGKEGGVAVIDLTTRSVQTFVPIGAWASDLVLTKDGRRIIAASFDDDNVAVIDTASLQTVATWPVGTGFGLVVHPSKPIVYSMNSFDGTVDVLNYDTGQVLATIDTGDFPTYSAITSDGRYLYVVNEDSHNVTKLDTETNQRVARFAVGREPADAVILEGD